MNAILLADAKHRNYHAEDFFQVYSDYVLEQLQRMTALESAPVYLEQFDEKRELLKKADIVFSGWGMPELSCEQIKTYLPNVKAVFYAGGDVRAFGTPFFQIGARMYATGHTNAIPASEYALAQVLLATKGIQRASQMYRSPLGYAQARQQVASRPGNYQASIGILGVGRVGSRLAQLLKGFDLNVYGCDPYLSPQKAKELGITLLEKEELFSSCDVITCHLPEWGSLRKTVGYAEFSAMQPHATFINVAQELPVDQEALIRAFSEVPTKTAILDTTNPMPLPEEHPLMHMPNVILTPHIAGSFGGELERMGLEVVRACEAFIENRPSEHEVDRESLRHLS